eukprot:scaffold64473_cov21-Prasinocladus_malaysianus.AAC.2
MAINTLYTALSTAILLAARLENRMSSGLSHTRLLLKDSSLASPERTLSSSVQQPIMLRFLLCISSLAAGTLRHSTV